MNNYFKISITFLCILMVSPVCAEEAITKPPLDVGLIHTSNVRTIFKINTAREKDGVNRGLYYVRSVLEQYEALGVPSSNLKISAVFLGDGTDALLKGKKQRNNQALIKDLIAKGVSIEICRESMVARKIERPGLIEGVKIVPSAFLRVIDLQQSGYAWIMVSG